MKKILFTVSIILFFACKEKPASQKNTTESKGKEIPMEYARGFSITEYDNYKLLKVTSPWAKSKKKYTYLLTEKNAKIPKNLTYNQKITIPVQKVVLTSTTHIPSVESLEEEKSLVGFPNLNYISSEKTRSLIKNGKVKELGKNESINTEILIDLQPDVVIGFAVESGNDAYTTAKKSGIPVVYNGDWTEKHPLGKAEWIKFFGAFYGKQREAETVFSEIETAYRSAKKLAQNTANRPTVLSGAMYKDVWHLPYGNSWQAQFIDDAHADYLYSNTNGSGSISLSIEHVLEKAKNADYWISPGAFTTYKSMKENSKHYEEFTAFQKENVYSFAGTTGATGGVLYYELAPNRPDLVLKDLIKIFHPTVLPDYEFTFFKPLQ